MAEGIVYLDVDDEITSAASRIRTAPGTKVALVVPYGSRIATSRMNFRLLSREAVISNRRLSIISGEAAARSLAASAGLPVFATTAEYEASLTQPAGPAAGSAAPAAASSRASAAADDADVGADAAAGGAAGSAAGASGAAAAPGGLAVSETVVAAGPSPGAKAPPPADDRAARRSQRPRRPVPDGTANVPLGIAPDHAAGAPEDDDLDGDEIDGRDRRNRAPLFAALGLVGLAIIVLAVGAYLFLPSATIAVTPRRDPVGPIELTVSADPDATEIDAATSTIPAVRLQVPVEAARTFTTTGTKVKETRAGGSVTFTNYDPTSANSIPAGSIVSTEGGIQFKTLSTLIVPRASFTPPSTTVPSEASVAIQAVKPGTEGNVPPNAIRVVPQGESSLFLAVHNPEATTGGTHTETPLIKQAEIDKALAALRGDLAAAFRENVASGAGAPAGTTLFPETAVLGAATPVPDPKTLVDQALETFDLKLKANGTVIAADPRPVETLARAALDAQVAKDHRLIEDSVVIDVGEGTVGEDGQVTFQATARATQVAIVDADILRSLVKGKTAADARAALVPYGNASVTLWPDWVSTVTGIDARLTVTVDQGAAGSPGGASPRPSASPGAAGRSTAPRSPGGSGGSGPASSGSTTP